MDATTTLYVAQVATSTNEIFNGLSGFIIIGLGTFFAFVAIGWFVGALKGSIKHATRF